MGGGRSVVSCKEQISAARFPHPLNVPVWPWELFWNIDNPQAAFKYAAQKSRLAAAGEELMSGTMIRLEKCSLVGLSCQCDQTQQKELYLVGRHVPTPGEKGGDGTMSSGWIYVCVCEFVSECVRERERERLQQSVQSIKLLIKVAGCGPFLLYWCYFVLHS